MLCALRWRRGGVVCFAVASGWCYVLCNGVGVVLYALWWRRGGVVCFCGGVGVVLYALRWRRGGAVCFAVASGWCCVLCGGVGVVLCALRWRRVKEALRGVKTPYYRHKEAATAPSLT